MSSCRDAILKDCLTVRPDELVEAVLKKMRGGKAALVPVLDADRVLVGLFSLPLLLEDAVSVSFSAGTTNLVLPAAPGMAKRFQRSLTAPVSALMERPARLLNPESPLEEAVQAVRQSGGAVPVAEAGSNIFAGIITAESILDVLEKE